MSGPRQASNPTDRGRPGTKRHLVTDRRGILLAFILTGANVHDSIPFEDLLDAVPPVAGKRDRPRRRPDKLHADKAYDYRRCRRACLRRQIKPRIARRGIQTSQKLGHHRWVIERSFAWFNKFRRLTIRYERRLDIHLPRVLCAHEPDIVRHGAIPGPLQVDHPPASGLGRPGRRSTHESFQMGSNLKSRSKIIL
jgi:transposase